MSRLTQLQAVNNILQASGRAPVNTIDTPTTLDATLATRLLETLQREVLARGWNFNTEFEVSLEVDLGTGYIPLGSSILTAEVADMPWVIQRGDKLYNRNAKTYIFDEAVTAKVIKWLTWDELPEAAKEAMWKSAAAKFLVYHNGESQAIQMLAQDALIAEAALREMDAEQGNYSIFDEPGIGAALPTGHMYMPGAPRGGYDSLIDRTPK